MTDERRLQGMTERIAENLVDKDGNPAPSRVVQEVVDEKAAEFEDAPVQEFVSLLVENRTRAELHQRGLGVDPAAFAAESPAAAQPDSDGENDDA